MTTRTRFRAAAIGLFVFGLITAQGQNSPTPKTHYKFNAIDPLTRSAGAPAGEASYKNPPTPICSTSTSSASNVNTDCEGIAPHNETAIAINPNNPLNMIATANDYQLFANSSGRTAVETVYTRAHVTFDGGKTWTSYPIRYNGYIATGDPGVAFDASGRAYVSTAGFVFSQGASTGTTAPDLLVASSTDGGQTWSAPFKVATGKGSSKSVGLAIDKPALTAWGNGNAIATWTAFNQGQHGSYISSPIYASVTHDGGRTWSDGVEISGSSASFCIGSSGDTKCDQDQGSVPVVAADGSIYVSFYSTDPTQLANGRDEYLVVKVDPATGQRIDGPHKVAGLYDGFYDYPLNQYGESTYQDSQFRTSAFGNIAADPTNKLHLALVWSDMRNSTLPAPSDPYSAKTNSDIIVSQSIDGGQTWSSPVSLTASGDQFMPWAAYDSSGRLRIGYFDRSYDLANHMYGYTLSTETVAGTLIFTSTPITTGLSDPTMGDRWFSSVTVNPSFPNPTSFLGDYSGIAVSSSGVAGLWTDMRLAACYNVLCGQGEDIFFAFAP
jgi:hypothetical protein